MSRKALEAEPATHWTVANAKARLSEVIDQAMDRGPQIITRNGKQAVVVVGFEEWTRRTQRKGSLLEFFQNSPLRGQEIEIEREEEQPRAAGL